MKRYTVQLKGAGDGRWSDALYTDDIARAFRFARLEVESNPRVVDGRVAYLNGGSVVTIPAGGRPICVTTLGDNGNEKSGDLLQSEQALQGRRRDARLD